MAESPIMIGSDTDSVTPCDLLINLCDEIPEFAASFPRVAEIVTKDDRCRTLSRKRFAAYRDDGHTIETHKL
jgi:DNA polymerase-3 subunit chi